MWHSVLGVTAHHAHPYDVHTLSKLHHGIMNDKHRYKRMFREMTHRIEHENDNHALLRSRIPHARGPAVAHISRARPRETGTTGHQTGRQRGRPQGWCPAGDGKVAVGNTMTRSNRRTRGQTPSTVTPTARNLLYPSLA